MILGIIILIIGLLYLISVMNPEFVINYGLIWPVVLILVCVYCIIKNKKVDIISGIGLFIGILILGVNANFWNNDVYGYIIPGCLIIVGLLIIINSISFKKNKEFKIRTADDKILTYSGILAGIEEKVNQKDFKGANIYAIFGGVDLDLRNVETKEDIVINAYSIFGGTSLLIPEGYNIKVNSTAILGGNDNKVNNEYNPKQKTIYVNCTSIFGGCEIK